MTKGSEAKRSQVSGERDAFTFRSPHGMKSATIKVRTFAGVAVRRIQHFNNPGRAWHDLSDSQDTLSIVLAEIGGRCEARPRMNQPAALERQRPNHISFIPADMRTWAYSDNIESVRELRLTFDCQTVRERLGPDMKLMESECPRLMFHDERILQCARLLADECDASSPSAYLYGEGLTVALLAACFQPPAKQDLHGLAGWQLRRVTEFIHEYLNVPLTLAQLAELADLSSSQFARLFKESTGIPPHRYQLRARIERSQELLLSSKEPLSEIAIATGFADQSHFTRVFRNFTGATPKQWKTDRKS